VQYDHWDSAKHPDPQKVDGTPFWITAACTELERKNAMDRPLDEGFGIFLVNLEN